MSILFLLATAHAGEVPTHEAVRLEKAPAPDPKKGEGKKNKKGGKKGNKKGGKKGNKKGGNGGDAPLRGDPGNGGGRDGGGPIRDNPGGGRDGGPRQPPPCGRDTPKRGDPCPEGGPRQPPQGGGPRQPPSDSGPSAPSHSRGPRYDWAGKFALGGAPGFQMSSRDGDAYLDPGFRVIARYRPTNVLGLELNASHHDSFGAFGWQRRAQTAFDGLLTFNAIPRTGGIIAFETGAQFNLSRVGETVDTPLVTDPRIGADLGIVFGGALSEHLTMEFGNRLVTWLFDEHQPGEPLLAWDAGMSLVGWF